MIRSFFLSIALLLTAGVLAENSPPVLSILTQQIAKTNDAATQLNLLRGMNAALKGRRGVTAPPEWAAVAEKLGKSSHPERLPLTRRRRWNSVAKRSSLSFRERMERQLHCCVDFSRIRAPFARMH